MAARKKNTWRVRGLDLRCSDDCLRRLLSEDDQGCADCTVHSLATEHHGHSQTATVSFTNGEATVAESLPPCTNHTGQYGSPALDDEFLGFTTLFAPPPEDHKIDIVAISGLGGHAFGSFKECGGEHMWLRDALPRHIVNQETGRPMARVLIYGYLSRVAASKSMQNVDDIAGPFREQLSGLTPPGAVARPVVFISHSLGGLVLKEAIISLAASSDADAERVRRTIYGLVFFGVPHAGMDNASLMTMAGKGPNRELVLSIGQTNSQFLTRQQRHFPGALETMGPQRREVFCFYETLESPTAVKTDGRWTMTGLSSILVSVTSATQCLLDTPDKQNHTCAIDRTHSEIVKFAAQDPWYDVVLQRLLRISRRAINESTAAAYHSTRSS
ncbi:uncharacterized protein B0I36DRAFT_424605 [Microdochium trichocladiopsis]|uniref:DUF676 domain-containing protein n=1 Tax=Microdochium trichocladiopsis TaxID=1682393 RepID=A0A9P8XY09_9PEZI|nr:uncharacterized protein B0I36DRAFT_424605 [Microdochium trichocladiopsis]KAH7024901.1 hypothetical protein B0I36DRAFT_424605 [Microdochium trichocladiopsis]